MLVGSCGFVLEGEFCAEGQQPRQEGVWLEVFREVWQEERGDEETESPEERSLGCDRG